MRLFRLADTSTATGSPIGPLKALLVGSIVLPALLFAGACWVGYHATFDEAGRDLLRIDQVVVEHAAKVFDSQKLVAERVADQLQGLDDSQILRARAALVAKMQRLIADLPQIQSFIVVAADGTLLLATDSPETTSPPNFADRDYFQDLRHGGPQPFISRVQTSRVNGKPFFGLGRRLERPDGSFAGVIDIAIAPRFFSDFWSTLVGTGEGEGWVITMVRADGQILVRYPPLPGDAPMAPPGSVFFEALARNPEHGSYVSHSLVDPATPERHYTYTRIPGFPVYLVAGRSTAAIVAEWWDSMSGYLVFGLPATLMLFMATRVALVRTRRERTALAQARQEISLRERAEADLRQVQKMEAVGQLTGGIAHDFNNLLAGIIGSLELIRGRLAQGRGADLGRYIDGAMESANRAASLTHRLLAFSRRQTLEPKPTDPNQLVAAMAELIRRTIGPAIHLETVLSAGLWPTLCDAHQLENALLNLAINARDAMPTGGRLTIETGNARLDDAYLDDAYTAGEPELAAGAYVAISVTDTGCGMSPEVQKRAFEPFFTTKPMGQGTGLGLSMIYGFIKQSEGHVRINSEPGQGTTVLLYLPRFTGPLDPPPLQQPVALTPAADTGQTVLVVEDEAVIRVLIMDVLTELGYTAIEAADGNEGLRVLRSPRRIDLVITDVGLPGGMNGRQMADAARLIRPGLKLLFVTGYAENAAVGNGYLDANMQMMTKPFTLDALSRRIRSMIAEA